MVLSHTDLTETHRAHMLRSAPIRMVNASDSVRYSVKFCEICVKKTMAHGDG